MIILQFSIFMVIIQFSDGEQILQNGNGVFGSLDSMYLLLRYLLNLFINFVIVATWESLVAEKVNFLVVLDKLEAVGFVPAYWKNVK